MEAKTTGGGRGRAAGDGSDLLLERCLTRSAALSALAASWRPPRRFGLTLKGFGFIGCFFLTPRFPILSKAC